MKFALWFVMAILFGGCAATTSTGLLRGYPSDQAPIVRCYIRAQEYLPPFVIYSDEAVPKRSAIRIELEDAKTGKSVLDYEGKLEASPRNLDFGGNLHGDRFTVKIFDRDTHQSWIIEFRRKQDGRFYAAAQLGRISKLRAQLHSTQIDT
jgi:hypothetical protein